MPQLIRPATTITVVPRDGELEITLNINITVDGQTVTKEEETKDEKVHIIPDFVSGVKLSNFGKG